MPQRMEQAIGVLGMWAVLIDVFLTVLYARMGTGLLSGQIARLTWLTLRAAAPARHRGAVLSVCGPLILVLLVLVWAVLLAFGAGLIMQPELGAGIRASQGQTPTDLVTAVYIGGSSLSLVGSSDYQPHTTMMRLVFLFNSIVGASILSLTLTYLMQVYSALRERNALALQISGMSGGTGDAAELLAHLAPGGQFSAGYSDLSSLASSLSQTKEAHHFYPVLFYFRFREPLYAASRTTLMALDTVALIRTALDDADAGWLKQSAAVEQMQGAAMLLATSLQDNFLGGPPGPDSIPELASRWRARYAAALARLRAAGLPVVADGHRGAEAYIAARARWDPIIRNLAPAMGYGMAEIDPAGSAAPG